MCVVWIGVCDVRDVNCVRDVDSCVRVYNVNRCVCDMRIRNVDRYARYGMDRCMCV